MSSSSTTCSPVTEELHSLQATPHKSVSPETSPSDKDHANFHAHSDAVLGPADGDAVIESPAKPRSFWLTLIGILVILFVYSLDATALSVAIPVRRHLSAPRLKITRCGG